MFITNCEQIRDFYFLQALSIICGSMLFINNGLIIN